MKRSKNKSVRRRGNRRRAYRKLAAEMLEDRVLLAGDLLHNAAFAADVNADGQVNVQDILEVVKELRNGGSRALSGGEGEGEPSQTMFIDVNGDGFLSMQDVTTVVGYLRGEGAPGDLVVTLRPRVGGVLATTVGLGQAFTVDVVVQDFRTGVAPADRGLLFGDFDMTFSTAFADFTSIAFSAPYQILAPSITNEAVGFIDNVSGVDFTAALGGNPVGANAVTMFTVTFQATALGTVDLTAGVDLAPGTANQPSIFSEPNLPEVLPGDIVFNPASITVVNLTPNVPVGNPDTYDATEDTQLVVNDPGNQSGDGVTNPPPVGVLDNDTDADQPPGFPAGTTLSAQLESTTTSAGGTVALNADGTFTYDPPLNFNGVDTFQYRATDGGQQSALTTVTINVAAVADNPIAVDDLYSIARNGLLDATISPPPGLLDNDSDGDAGDTPPHVLRVTQINSVNVANGQTVELAGGTLVINEDGTFTYQAGTNTPDFIGVETFTYTVESFVGAAPTGEPAAMAQVDIEVGITPRNVSGFVYIDSSNDGIRDAGEIGIGGVRIDLTGTDFRGAPVSRTTTTNILGEYLFDAVEPGDYTIAEIHPGIMVDGIDTPGNLGIIGPPANDAFSIRLTGEFAAFDYNFGELGRPAAFFSLADFLASSSANPSLATFSADGTLLWTTLDPVSWQGIASLSIVFNGDGTVTMTATDDTTPVPNVFMTTLSATGDPRFQLLAQGPGGFIINLVGTRADFFP